MRLFIVPIILVALLVQAPAPALGQGNQIAADKIASVIAERFPDADILVEYQSGQVRMQGEASSQEQKTKIVELIPQIPGVEVKDIKEDIKIVVPVTPTRSPAQVARPTASPATAPVPMPANTSAPRANGAPARMVTTNARQAPQTQQANQPQMQPGAALAPYPQQHYPAAYGLQPGQPSAVPAPFAPNPYNMPLPAGPAQQYAGQYQPAYGPPAQGAYHPEAYGPQGPLPGRYNQPNMPDYAWPAYANYPNYAQVSYPRTYSPKAWPYIGPFYPYPQVPLGWRKVTLEHHNGWWWLDFDDGTPSGPFSGLFRQPAQYTY